LAVDSLAVKIIRGSMNHKPTASGIHGDGGKKNKKLINSGLYKAQGYMF
jgi:hypothetical protein